jgi:hypothetical protein
VALWEVLTHLEHLVPTGSTGIFQRHLDVLEGLLDLSWLSSFERKWDCLGLPSAWTGYDQRAVNLSCQQLDMNSSGTLTTDV